VSYAALVEYQRRLWQLRHVEAFAAWDEATMMPEGGGAARAEALSALRGFIHQQATRADLADLFAAAAAEVGQLLPWQQANLREMEREWVHATALPQDLVEAMSRAESLSEQAWRRLRPNNDFAGFLGFFREVVRLKREAAQAVRRAHPDVMEQIRRGDFAVLDTWLRDHVWSRGSLLSCAELVEQATGSPLGTEAFEGHLERRYVQREL
jgi:Zn-dependent M32 family carboxypeptidase